MPQTFLGSSDGQVGDTITLLARVNCVPTLAGLTVGVRQVLP